MTIERGAPGGGTPGCAGDAQVDGFTEPVQYTGEPLIFTEFDGYQFSANATDLMCALNSRQAANAGFGRSETSVINKLLAYLKYSVIPRLVYGSNPHD